MKERMRRAFDWWFRDRRTGEVVIAQMPNVPLVVFLVASVVRGLVRPEGVAGTVLDVVVVGSLLGWAADEVLRGVNPFRRLLGATVAAFTVAGLVLS